MNSRLILTAFAVAVFSIGAVSQQPKYTAKYFVSADDPKEFVRIIPAKDGFCRTYILANPPIWDLDDNRSTYIKGGQAALLCVEGQYKAGLRDGVFTFYLIDSLDHTKRYKIWEQTFLKDKLNGEWRTFSLAGTLVNFQTYKNDSLDGVARDFWIDGKSILKERIFFNGGSKYIYKEFFKGGILSKEMTFVNEVPNGPAKQFYPDGVLKDEVILRNGKPNGLRRYYYPSGKIWIEQEMKDGLPWTVIANYTESGQKRNPGTLVNGNGTVIFYNEDGSIRETVTYKNGVETQ